MRVEQPRVPRASLARGLFYRSIAGLPFAFVPSAAFLPRADTPAALATTHRR